LGPLSLAQTRKLIWRLPGLDALTGAQQQRARTDVGGHPRALEYLDALLRHGGARFDDVTDRLERLLSERGIPDPRQWIADLHAAADDDPKLAQDRLVGRALAETITLTANDTLLERLIGLLDPDTRHLLIGAAVYRNPVDELALVCRSVVPRPIEADPDRDRRLVELSEKLVGALAAGRLTDDLTSLGFSSEQLPQLSADVATVFGPPPTNDTVAPRLATLGTLGLLTPLPSPVDGSATYVVHRWTATALGRLHPEATAEAHRLAAAYYTWLTNADGRPPTDLAGLSCQLEARYHHHAAGDLEAAVELSYAIRDQLHTWAAWDWEAGICRETLAWLPPGSYDTAAFTHQLGVIAQLRGDYGEAEQYFRQAKAVAEALGDPATTAASHHHLGMLAQARGDYQEAERRYRLALTINQESGNQLNIASSHLQLGMLAQAQGNYQKAKRGYLLALAINEKLGHQANIASNCHQLGMLAQAQGHYSEAMAHYERALGICKQLGDPAGAASCHHQLGCLAHIAGDYERAEHRYEKALTISEDLGNRPAAAAAYGTARHARVRPGRL
jgi:tetratricopeptide (TPR) repeat protein